MICSNLIETTFSMTLTQVSTWFANARRRLKKENRMTWDRSGDENEVDIDDSNEGELDCENRTFHIALHF